jgi:methanogenic corrinoid protein MtbC1
MTARADFSNYDDKPLYNTRAVVHATGIPASTLRAWERRYHILAPRRTSKAYRLYSERDIATIRWLHQQLQNGLTISQAAALLTAQQSEDQQSLSAPRASEMASALPADLATLAQRLYHAFLTFDEQEAEAITSLALAYHAVDEVCLDLLAATQTEIGEGWHRGEVPVTAEHFGSNFVRSKLFTLLQLMPAGMGGPLVIVACAPEEQHEIGALLVALFLRWSGYHILYLGQNVPITAMLNTVRSLQPTLVCMSATTELTAHHLAEFSRELAQLAHPPRFVFGGGAYVRNPDLQGEVEGHYIAGNAREVPPAVESLLHNRG